MFIQYPTSINFENNSQAYVYLLPYVYLIHESRPSQYARKEFLCQVDPQSIFEGLLGFVRGYLDLRGATWIFDGLLGVSRSTNRKV